MFAESAVPVLTVDELCPGFRSIDLLINTSNGGHFQKEGCLLATPEIESCQKDT